jgi:hypothetical protein
MSPWYMSAFTLEGLGRYAAAAEHWRHIIAWLEAHDMSVHTAWPKEMLASVEAKLAATSEGNGPDVVLGPRSQ